MPTTKRTSYRIDTNVHDAMLPVVKKHFRDNETLYIETLIKQDMKKRGIKIKK